METEITNQLNDKFQKIGQDIDVHLQGLLHSKPINYWDYIHTDALLNLQLPRTNFPDEMVFIMYHQINELLFKMIQYLLKAINKSNIKKMLQKTTNL